MTCCSSTSVRSWTFPSGSGPIPYVPDFTARPRRLGLLKIPVGVGVLLPQLRRWDGPSPSTRARPGPPSRLLTSETWDRWLTAYHDARPTLLPDVEALLMRRKEESGSRLLPLPDRPLLPARRTHPPPLEGLRRRRGCLGGDSRVLRTACGNAANGWRLPTAELSFTCP